MFEDEFVSSVFASPVLNTPKVLIESQMNIDGPLTNLVPKAEILCIKKKDFV